MTQYNPNVAINVAWAIAGLLVVICDVDNAVMAAFCGTYTVYECYNELVLLTTDHLTTLAVCKVDNDKIKAVKWVRSWFNLGLKEAKDIVDDLWNNRI